MSRETRLASRSERTTRPLFAALSLLVVCGACATTNGGTSDKGTVGVETSADSMSELYRRRCVECHGLPAPSSLSDAGWRRIMSDMGPQARLSAEQTEAMTAWLCDRNGR